MSQRLLLSDVGGQDTGLEARKRGLALLYFPKGIPQAPSQKSAKEKTAFFLRRAETRQKPGQLLGHSSAKVHGIKEGNNRLSFLCFFL